MTKKLLSAIMGVQPTTESDEVPTNKPRTTIYLEPEIYKALENRAKAEKRTISNLCNLLLEQEMLRWLDEREANPPPSKAKRV